MELEDTNSNGEIFLTIKVNPMELFVLNYNKKNLGLKGIQQVIFLRKCSN